MSDVILIFLLCFLATTKVTLQGRFAKTSGNSSFGALTFNTVIFASAAVLFARWLIGCHASTALFGAVFGVLTVLFQLFYVMAMSGGNVSLTVMFVNFSMVIPIAFSVIYGKEHITPIKAAGIALIVLALALTFKKGKGGEVNHKRWLLTALAAALINGGLSICQKLYGMTVYSSEGSGFVAWAYLIAFLLSFAVCFLRGVSNKENRFSVSPRAALLGVSAGAVLAVFQWLNTYAVSAIDAAVIFPSYYGGSMILSAMSGVLILKDKLTKRQICAILIGIVAIVILNI